MLKFQLLKKIKEIYKNGDNIIKFLKSQEGNKSNSIEDILISYDFQSGSYIKSFLTNPQKKDKYCKSIAKVIDGVGNFDSIMEVGVGEATTLTSVINYMKKPPDTILGFDLSWSRLKFAKEYAKKYCKSDIKFFTANLFEIPLKDNSIDIIYTSHSLEPNGGKEEQALKELFRVAKKFIVLLEPSYELGSEAARARMSEHGYVTKLRATALALDYNVLEHKLFEHCANPLNPTGLIIIKKDENNSYSNPNLVCPISKTDLKEFNESLHYSENSLLSYPVIEGIPCLLKENAILTTHLTTNYEEFEANIKG